MEWKPLLIALALATTAASTDRSMERIMAQVVAPGIQQTAQHGTRTRRQALGVAMPGVMSVRIVKMRNHRFSILELTTVTQAHAQARRARHHAASLTTILVPAKTSTTCQCMRTVAGQPLMARDMEQLVMLGVMQGLAMTPTPSPPTCLTSGAVKIGVGLSLGSAHRQ